MIVVDTSAVIAILLQEAEATRLARVIADAEIVSMSVASVVEAGMVAYGRAGDAGLIVLRQLLQDEGLQLEPVSIEQMNLAIAAFTKYGKGNHKAALNFGDCFAYALARSLNQPLLFKGGDFALTDIQAVAY